jgi:hypothetical protein
LSTDHRRTTKEFETAINGVRVLAVGALTEEDLGVKCYHSKLGAVELLLNHLIDGEREYVIVDMTAGTDAFASSLFAKFDLSFLIVEPTQQSVSVYRQYSAYARSYGVTLKVIANKINDADDLAFVSQHAGGDLIAALSSSSWVRALEKGRQLAWTDLEPENVKALNNIRRAVDARQKETIGGMNESWGQRNRPYRTLTSGFAEDSPPATGQMTPTGVRTSRPTRIADRCRPVQADRGRANLDLARLDMHSRGRCEPCGRSADSLCRRSSWSVSCWARCCLQSTCTWRGLRAAPTPSSTATRSKVPALARPQHPSRRTGAMNARCS